MLYKSTEQSASSSDVGVSAARTDQFDPRWLVVAILQHRRLIIILPLVLMALAVLFVLVRPPSFTASTQLQLNNLRLTFSREDAFFAETHPDPTFLETQLQIIRSDRVAFRVLNSLEMLAADAPVEQKAEALEQLHRGFLVDRAGLSNVVQILYTARDPKTAARFANEFARAYTAELNAARLDAAQAGSSWLRDRLREVGPKSRVIAEALPPLHKSNLRGIIIIAAAGVLGGGLAIAIAIAWKLVDRRVMTPEEATAATGAECLGIVPRLPTPVKSGVKKTQAVQEDRRERDFSANSSIFAYALNNPMSLAWHTLRNVIAACQDCFGGKGLRYLGVTSTFSGEGRSTIAANLALALAAADKRVLLVDCDIYNQSLSRHFASENCPGLVNYLQTERDALPSYVWVEHPTGLHFLPLGVAKGGIAGNIWTDKMQRFLDETSTAYDCVIFDMPTLGTLGDMRASARYVEGFLLVVGWRLVSSDSIQVGMRAANAVYDRLLGSVLNNLDTKEALWSLSPQTTFSLRQNRLIQVSRNVVHTTGRSGTVLSRPGKWAVLLLVGAGVLAAAILSMP